MNHFTYDLGLLVECLVLSLVSYWIFWWAASRAPHWVGRALFWLVLFGMFCIMVVAPMYVAIAIDMPHDWNATAAFNVLFGIACAVGIGRVAAYCLQEQKYRSKR